MAGERLVPTEAFTSWPSSTGRTGAGNRKDHPMQTTTPAAPTSLEQEANPWLAQAAR